MDNLTTGVGASAVLAIGVLLVALIVLWVLLPFAVFGIKDRLTRLLHEQRRTNALLERIARADGQLEERSPSVEPTRAKPDRGYPPAWPGL